MSFARRIFHSFAFAVAYLAAAELGYWLGGEHGRLVAWPPSGLYLAVLLKTGLSAWPAVFASALFANAASEVLLHQKPVLASVMLGLGDSLEAFVGARLLHRAVGEPFRLNSASAVIGLIAFGAFSSGMLGASIGAATRMLAFGDAFGSSWRTCWLADAVGVIIVAPAILVFQRAKWRRLRHAQLGRILEALLLLGLTVAAVQAVFGSWHPALQFAYLVFPFLLWAALRFSLPGAALSLVILATIAIVNTTAGQGPFAVSGLSGPQKILQLQSFLGVSALSVLLLAAMVDQEWRARRALRRAYDGLEMKIRHRTEALTERNAQLRSEIAERQRAEKTLQENALRMTALLDNLMDGIVTINEQGIVESFSRAAERIFGYTAAEMIGRNVNVLMPEPHRSQHAGYIRNYLNTGIARIIGSGREVVGLRKDGSTFPLDLGISVFYLDGQRRFTGILRDITERKRAEAALRDSELRYRALVEATAQVVWQTDEKGASVFSPASFWRDLTGQSDREMLGWGWLQAIHPDDRDRARQAWQEAFRTRRPFEIEYRVRTREGSYRHFQSRGVPILQPDGKIIEWVGAESDISLRREMELERELIIAREQQLRIEAEAANRAKDEFLAVISHELRSPLNAITGWVHLLAHQRPLQEETLDRAVDVIRRSATQQKQLIEDLLDTARVISGKLKLEIQPVNLAPLMEGALDAVRPAAEARDIRLYTQIDASAGQITGDPQRLQQIVWNLLSNAVKFTPQGGRVELSLTRVDPHLRLTVRDTGKGIAREFLPEVFDRFRQADSSSTRRHGGLGLGLALVKHLTELHGGTIRAESEGEGLGATFTVDLPLRAVLSMPPSPLEPTVGAAPADGSPRPANSLAGLRILVVDDQAEARDLLAAVLAQQGAEVHTRSSAEEALACLKDAAADVLLCDIGMPGEDGYAVVRKLRALEAARGIPLARRLPAIALTAYAGPDDRLRALTAGFQTHLAKPVDPVELIAAIAGLVLRERSAGGLTVN
jgi:PAS domain S-box-containing protein